MDLEIRLLVYLVYLVSLVVSSEVPISWICDTTRCREFFSFVTSARNIIACGESEFTTHINEKDKNEISHLINCPKIYIWLVFSWLLTYLTVFATIPCIIFTSTRYTTTVQMIYFFGFSYITLFVLVFTASQTSQKTHPTVGVIRWDAWNLFDGQYDSISFYSHRCLSPEKFHYRLPFFATVLSPTNTSYNGDLQSVMDQEILYAKHAGLDYWAFDTYCTYGPNCTTNSTYCAEYLKIAPHYCPRNPAYGLHQYLSSQYNLLMKFTLLLLGSSPCDPAVQEGYLELMVHPQFQTVLGGRPLLYLFQFDDAEANLCGGGWSGSRDVFNRFRQMATNRGLQNPYMVLMDFEVLTVKTHADLLGFDAISMYALPGGAIEGLPFVDLVHVAQQWWQAAHKANAKLVPIVPTGWDARPRFEHPVPWLNEGPEHYFQPTGEELQQFFKTAINFTCQYNETVEAQTTLVYAWNENSENGAPLIPTLGNGTLYVDALSKIFPLYC